MRIKQFKAFWEKLFNGEKELYDVIVNGAGPIGLRTAIELHKNGVNVVVLEEHPEIGLPEQCSGLISINGIMENNLPIEDCKTNEIFGAKIFSPNGTCLEIKKEKPVAIVINRQKYDKAHFREAQRIGVEVRANTKLVDVRQNTVFLKSNERGELAKARIIIGADGVNSKIRQLMKIPIGAENLVQGYQIRAKGSFDEKIIEMHFGNFAENFFAWIIPENKRAAKIGLGTKFGNNAKQCFKQFLETKKIECEAIEEIGGMIPIGKPIENPVLENMLLVGDAGFQTKATTGGGLIIGANSAGICAKTISEHLKNNKPLSDYSKNLKEISKELLLHWKIRKFLNSQSEKQLDNLLEKAKKAGIEEFLSENGDMDKPSKFIGKILMKPKLWSLAPIALQIK